MDFKVIHKISELSGSMAHGVVLAALGFDSDFAGSLEIKLYSAPIPNYTPLHRSIKEMNNTGRRVGYLACL